jgi:hypothetical protein
LPFYLYSGENGIPKYFADFSKKKKGYQYIFMGKISTGHRYFLAFGVIRCVLAKSQLNGVFW